METRALVLRDAVVGPDIEALDLRDPGPGEMVVRMAASGICGSDLHVLHGHSAAVTYPMVLGHEGSGTIESLGPGVTDRRIGEHVVIASLDPCYRCHACLRGSFYFCASQRPLAPTMRSGAEPVRSYASIGSLAERAIVPAARAVPVSPDVDLALLATTGCGVLTGLGAVFNTATPDPGDAVLVIGCGGVGLNVIQGCRLAGARHIVAVDTSADRLQLAGLFGATTVVDASREEVEAVVRAVVPDGVDLSFEVVGNPTLVAQALDLTRRGGTCVMLGASPPDTELRLPSRMFMMTERTLTGCLMGHSLPQRDIPKIVDLYRAGRVMLDELVGERLPFAEWKRAFDDTASGKVARCLLTFDQP